MLKNLLKNKLEQAFRIAPYFPPCSSVSIVNFKQAHADLGTLLTVSMLI